MRRAHALLSVEIYTRVTTTRQCESKMYKGGGGSGLGLTKAYVIKSNQIKFYLVTHNTYYVHFITSVVTEEIL